MIRALFSLKRRRSIPLVRGLSTLGSTPFRLALQPLRPDASVTQCFFVDESLSGARISPWHQIPLVSEGKDSVVNMVCGMPRNSTAQFNVSTMSPFNPLEQRKEGGAPFFSQLNSPCDMGEAPQTWQAPEVVDPFTGSPGCGAPLGLVDLTPNLPPSSLGNVYPLRIIGALPLVINGVTTWKLAGVRAQDASVSSVACLITSPLPPSLDFKARDVLQWLRLSEVMEGGAEGRVVGGGWVGREEALKVLGRCHSEWEKLRTAGGPPTPYLFGLEAAKAVSSNKGVWKGV